MNFKEYTVNSVELEALKNLLSKKRDCPITKQIALSIIENIENPQPDTGKGFDMGDEDNTDTTKEEK